MTYFYHPIVLSSYHPISWCPLRMSAVCLYHDEPEQRHQPAKMILASLVLLSIIVVVSVSLTELIGVREGTAA